MKAQTQRREAGLHEMSLADVMQRADVWRGSTPLTAGSDAAPVPGVSSGFVALDALLPGGGFPIGALTEVLLPRAGIGELQLVLPAVERMTRNRWLAFVAPPYVPYAPALVRAGIDLSHVLVIHARAQHDMLWSIEQSLRAGTCGAVLAWPAQTNGQIDFKWLRRLQLAAEAGGTMGVLFRPAGCVATPSAAALRLSLDAQPEGLGVRILKRRGGWPTGPINVDWSELRQGRRLRRKVMNANTQTERGAAAGANEALIMSLSKQSRHTTSSLRSS